MGLKQVNIHKVINEIVSASNFGITDPSLYMNDEKSDIVCINSGGR